MRSRPVFRAAVLASVLMACTSTPVESTPFPTVSAVPSTATGPATATTSTSLAVFQPVQPSEDQLSTYALLAATRLEVTTKYSLNAFEDDFGTWAAVMRDGGIAACAALFAGLSPADVVREALQATPARNVSVDDYDDELILATLLVTAGVETYCPELDPGFSDPDKGPLMLTNAWLEVTGEDPIEESELIRDGTWVVGTDVQPGTYRYRGTNRGCYWERLAGFSGESSDRIAHGFSDDPQEVTIDPTDVGFLSRGCGFWHLVKS